MSNQEETKSKEEQDRLYPQQIEEDGIIKGDEEFGRDYPATPPWIAVREQEMRELEFNDSFNDGYNLAKNNPEAYEAVMSDIWEDEKRVNAFVWGRWMFEQEMKKDDSNQKKGQTLSEIQSIRAKSRDKQKTRER